MTFSRLIISIACAVLPISLWGEQLIVPENILQHKELGMAAKFLQKYSELLDASSSEDRDNLILRTKDDGFTYLKGNDEALRTLPDDTDFILDFNDGCYSAHWDKNGKVLVSCRFPAKVGMLLLGNKKELEDRIIERLSSSTANTIDKIPSAPANALSQLPFSELLVKDGDYFVTSSLSNRLVFKRKGDRGNNCCLVIDSKKYPLESLANIFISGYHPYNINCDISVRRYGYESTTVSIDFSNLHALFSEEGCSPFWGIKEYSGAMVKGLYLWKNDMGGYCHVLSVETPLSILTSENRIKATLHAYVRLDNLKSLFEEFPDL